MAKKKTKKKKTKKKAAAKPTPTKTTPEVIPYPTAGPKVVDFEEALDRSLGSYNIDPGKPKRGRPRNQPEPEPAPIDAKVIAQAMQIPFDLWAVSQKLDGLKLTDAEAFAIAKPTQQLLDHYLPQIPEIAWAWISLAAVSHSIMKSRLALIAETKRLSASSPSAQTDSVKGNSPTPSQQGQGGPGPSASFPSFEEIQAAKQKPIE